MESVRVRLDLAYDGSGFAGWAAQPGLRTVQGELETALEKLLRLPVRVTVAGRTDAGVHARGQVVHFDLPFSAWSSLEKANHPRHSAVRRVTSPIAESRQSEQFLRSASEVLTDRLAAVLPGDIVVSRAIAVPPGFDARFSAGSRRYVFRIDDGVATDPLIRNFVLRHRGLLEVDAMDTASRSLVGLHDFGAFCKAREGGTTIRRLISFAWRRPVSGPDAGLVVGTIRADAFCHNMVRAMVGSVIKVGEGRQPVEWPLSVLRRRDRANAAAIAGPQALTLEQISYPPPPFDAERATQIRAKRSL